MQMALSNQTGQFILLPMEYDAIDAFASYLEDGVNVTEIELLSCSYWWFLYYSRTFLAIHH